MKASFGVKPQGMGKELVRLWNIGVGLLCGGHTGNVKMCFKEK